jgi:AI-2 transport protein TqsA
LKSEQANKVLVVVAIFFSIAVAFFILKELQAILLPFFIAVLITFVFLPLYKWLLEKRIPTFFAIVIIILIILILSNITSIFIIAGVNSFTAEFPKYEIKFQDIYNRLIIQFNLTPEDVSSFNESLRLKTLLLDGSLTTTLTTVFSTIIGIFGDFVLIILYMIFLLSELSSMKLRMLKAFSHERSKKLNKTFTDIFTDIRKYISGKTILSLIQAIVIGFYLWAFGVDFYFIWAFLFFITDYIPNIGSLIVTVLVGAVLFLQFDNFITPIIHLVVLVGIQNLKGNVIEPMVIGDKLDLSPLLILLSIIFWGYVWGIMGMILAVPIMSMIKIALINVESTRPIGILMSYKLTHATFQNLKMRDRIKDILKKRKSSKGDDKS